MTIKNILLYKTMYNDNKYFCYIRRCINNNKHFHYTRRCISSYTRQCIMTIFILHYIKEYVLITNIVIIRDDV